MKIISFIITNCGDGSNTLEWFSGALSDDNLLKLQESDFERYSSGDGVQYTELKFPDSMDIPEWARDNYIKFQKIDELLEKRQQRYLSWK